MISGDHEVNLQGATGFGGRVWGAYPRLPGCIAWMGSLALEKMQKSLHELLPLQPLPVQ